MRDSALALSLTFKAWQAAAGILGIALVARYLDPVSQGYYYTFASLIALQSFFELGLFLVISVSASHEWAHLSLATDGSIVGNRDARSRLISLGRFVVQWYGVASVLFLLIASTFGLYFFASQSNTHLTWRAPWLLHVLFSAVSMWLVPFLSLLEGCNQMAATARFRLSQSLLSTLAFWVALGAGMELWAVPVLSGCSLLSISTFLLVGRRKFMSSFREHPVGQVLSWRSDLLPMQWRLALQGLVGYFSFPLYVALTFSHHGAAEAGRLGMTLQIVGAMQSLSLVLVATRAPAFAIAVAQRQRQAMEREWKQVSIRSLIAMLGIVITFLAALQGAVGMDWSMVSRVLTPAVFVMLALGSFFGLMIQCMAMYLRAHKQERLTQVGLTSGLLYGLTAWFVVPSWGSAGVAFCYLVVTALVAFPSAAYLFRNSRREWNSAGA